MAYGGTLVVAVSTTYGEAVRPGDDAWLVHERRGDGPPLVLIHGIGSHWQVWRPVLDEVARHRTVIAVDLPGFGASPMWPANAAGAGNAPQGDPTERPPGSVGHLADRVAAFLDALGLDRPEVAGSSLGGGVALELGRRGLVRSVTAFAPVGFWAPAGRRWCQLVVRAARAASVALVPVLPRLLATRAGRVALCGVFYARPGQLDPADCLDAARALARAPGFVAACAALPTRAPTGLTALPVTIAWGTRDIVLPYHHQAARARIALPSARHVTLTGCGHLPFADDPVACAQLLTGRQ
jgi:pimeloyl-ACP methyl ester carboxylesterase